VTEQRNRPWRRFLATAMTATLSVALLAFPATRQAEASEPTDLIISEYIEGSSNNKALEIFNPTSQPIDLAQGQYAVWHYSNGQTTKGVAIALTGVVPAGGTHVVVNSQASLPGLKEKAQQTDSQAWFNGDDALVLVKGEGGATIVDSIGKIGQDPGSEWGSGNTSTADNTLRRLPSVVVGDTDPTDDFNPADQWAGYPRDNFEDLGHHEVNDDPVNLPIVASCPASLTTFEGNGATGSISASDADGTVSSITLAEPVPAGISLTDVSPATAVGGTATAKLSIGSTLAEGSYAVRVLFANQDGEPQTADCTVNVSVTGLTTIGEVQGAVADGMDGHTFRSPYAPPSGNGTGDATVVVQGVITQMLKWISSGKTYNGLLLQNTPAQADGDPTTSDGILVFMNTFSDLLTADGGKYVPVVGDEVVLSGKVSEYFGLTQISGSVRVQAVVTHYDDLAAVIAPAEANPPNDAMAASVFWERLEGMQVRIPAGSIVLGPPYVFASSFDSEFHVLNGSHEVAQRENPYARRAFRDAHPLDNDPALFDDQNGYRIIVGSLGLKGTTGNDQAVLAPARTYNLFASDAVGGVYYGFNKYTVQVAQQPNLGGGVDPALNNPPTPANLEREFTVASSNVENLYDFRDDPFDSCDFDGNYGCPAGKNPQSFDYAPDSEAEYQVKLNALAGQILNDLHAPDILLVQEAEDQDICSVANGAMVCGNQNNADGKPDTLQEMGLAIAAMGGPTYDAAFDRDGADDRGIVSGFLYRTDRVELLPIDLNHPVLGKQPTVQYRSAAANYNSDVQNPKVLNAALPGDVDTSTGTDGNDVFTRAPQVGLFRVWRNGVGASTYTDLYVIANHFSSGPDRRVGQRKEQAAYNAAIVAALQAMDPNVKVVVGGDLNIYPRPDEARLGEQHDQLGALYNQGLTNLFDQQIAENPASAYGYVYDGQTQTLDQMFVSNSILNQLIQSRVAHINADWSAGYMAGRGVSDHDPQVARVEFLPTLESLSALVNYYDAAGSFKGNQVARILLDRIEQVRTFLAEGQTQAAQSQMEAFMHQVSGFQPVQIDDAAANALIAEAQFLLQNNW